MRPWAAAKEHRVLKQGVAGQHKSAWRRVVLGAAWRAQVASSHPSCRSVYARATMVIATIRHPTKWYPPVTAANNHGRGVVGVIALVSETLAP